jgi:hypothetical protein
MDEKVEAPQEEASNLMEFPIRQMDSSSDPQVKIYTQEEVVEIFVANKRAEALKKGLPVTEALQEKFTQQGFKKYPRFGKYVEVNGSIKFKAT